MIDPAEPDDDDFTPLPPDYDDSEPGAIPELCARPLVRDGGLGDVLLPPKPPLATAPPKAEP